MQLFLRATGNTLSPIRCLLPSLCVVGPIAILFVTRISIGEIFQLEALTVKICRSHKGNMNTKVTMVGRAIEAEVYAKRD